MLLFAAGLSLSYYIGHKIGYKDGWIAYSIDSIAVSEYHEQADALLDDENADSLAKIWSRSISTATRLETEWDSFSLYQKWNYSVEPFWKEGRGGPRRISKKTRKALVEVLTLE